MKQLWEYQRDLEQARREAEIAVIQQIIADVYEEAFVETVQESVRRSEEETGDAASAHSQ